MKFETDHKINRILILIIIQIMIISFISCNSDYMPKPRGYFRIDLPEKSYQKFDTSFPFTFDYPTYAQIISDDQADNKPYWINLDFPAFKGRVHLSYKRIEENLPSYLEDTHAMAFKHISKATAIENRTIYNQQDSVYGLIFEIKGLSAASPYQFFVTDSIHHFLRGALYFNVAPNNDSLAPVIEFIKEDIEHLITTFKWSSVDLTE